jgi:hypothetical protein
LSGGRLVLANGTSKITQLRSPSAASIENEDILWLQVAMCEMILVEASQTVTDVNAQEPNHLVRVGLQA